jgi:hypothetical protein
MAITSAVCHGRDCWKPKARRAPGNGNGSEVGQIGDQISDTIKKERTWIMRWAAHCHSPQFSSHRRHHAEEPGEDPETHLEEEGRYHGAAREFTRLAAPPQGTDERR